VFELPSKKLERAYVPQRLMSSAPTQRGIGLHRADPKQRIVGVVCQGFYQGGHLVDHYVMVIISTADLRAHASIQSVGELRVRWEKWQSSATIVKLESSITGATHISGSRFFAVVRGVPYTKYATLLRIYDFSPGARGRRHPTRSAVQDLIVNAGRVVEQTDTTSWELSEDNLLMFHVSAEYRIHEFLV